MHICTSAKSDRRIPARIAFPRRGLTRSIGVLVAALTLIAERPFLFSADPVLEIATFRADLTPPVGEGACIGFMPKIATVEHPLELKGVILRNAGGESFIVAAIDYCGLCNSTDDLFRLRLAEAAGTTVERVALQSLHQHTAPVLDVDGAKLLYAKEPQRWQAHAALAEAMADRAARAVKESATSLMPVTRVVASQAKVDKVASNRRVPLPDGSLAARLSSTRDPAMQEAPEGLIDPWLRTVSFFDGEQALVQLHYYATHPQSFYGDERISWDVPGIARERLQRETGVFQIYFNGCGGNIAMGKYNDGSKLAREILSERLYLAMRDSGAVAMQKGATQKGPVPEKSSRPDAPKVVKDFRLETLGAKAVAWDVVKVKFEPRDDGEFGAERIREILLRPEQPQLKAAMLAAWTNRLRAGHTVGLSRLRIGSIELLHLPGEPFVEFQLFAQRAAPQSFVCVAGYGECGIWYYGPDSIFLDRGGYEQTWSFAAPCQALVEDALTRLLTGDPKK